MNEKQRKWLHGEAGQRIDALEAALNAFGLYHLDSLIALRRQVHVVWKEAQDLEFQEIIEAADQAHLAGALDARKHVERLLAVLRKAVGSCRVHAPVAHGDLDVESGLMSRAAFTRRFEEAVHGRRGPAALAAFHVANLPAVKKEHGEEVGRQLLAHVGSVIAGLVRAEDCVARYGGAEFVVFLPGESSNGLQAALVRLEAAIARQPLLLSDGRSVPISLTIGGCPAGLAPEAGDTQSAMHVPRIAIVAHGAATGKVLKQMLQRADFDVLDCGGGDAKTDLLATTRVSVVLVEESSEGLPALLEKLRGMLAHRRTPILVVAVSEQEGRWAMEHGASDFLLKPIELQALLGAVNRLAHRGRGDKAADAHHHAAPEMLIVSQDLAQLIAMGTSLQKQTGYLVRFGCGAADALEQARQHTPAAVLLDLRLHQHDCQELLHCIALLHPAPAVLLLVEPYERARADTITKPHIAMTISKPASLLTLAADVQRATGLAFSKNRGESTALLQKEILRVMQQDVPRAHE